MTTLIAFERAALWASATAVLWATPVAGQAVGERSAQPSPSASVAVDPVARTMAEQALAAADAPAITKTTIVGTDIAGTAPVAQSSGTIGSSSFQANGSDPETTGYLAFKYGADAKGVINYWAKTRGAAMNSYAAVELGDRIVSDFWQAGTGAQTGHVGGTQVTVDNAAFTAGEVAGRWTVFTGTGIQQQQASKTYPNRFGSITAIAANSYQQVLFPGGVSGALPPEGSNFGGWVVIGAGAAAPGYGALKFLSADAALLAAPEPGAFEVDARATPYFTTGDGIRRRVVLADTGLPTVRALAAAGRGAAVSIDANGTAGAITLVTGADAGNGDVFAVSYVHPYANASYPVLFPGNAAAAGLVRSGYLTATAAGFTFTAPAGIAAGTTYTLTFQAPGR